MMIPVKKRSRLAPYIKGRNVLRVREQLMPQVMKRTAQTKRKKPEVTLKSMSIGLHHCALPTDISNNGPKVYHLCISFLIAKHCLNLYIGRKRSSSAMSASDNEDCTNKEAKDKYSSKRCNKKSRMVPEDEDFTMNTGMPCNTVAHWALFSTS